jgi:hypothetical protein
MKILCTIILMLFVPVVVSVAQKVHFGVAAGALLSSIAVEGYDDEGTSSMQPGFSAGILAEMNLSDRIIFQPGLHFVRKGGVWEFPSGTDTFVLNYLELPLNVAYRIGNFFVGAGPSIAMGLGGKLKADFNSGTSAEYDASFSSSGDQKASRFEFGANVLAGYEILPGLFAAANFNLGLNEHYFLVDENRFNGIKNRYAGLRIGYMLQK